MSKIAVIEEDELKALILECVANALGGLSLPEPAQEATALLTRDQAAQYLQVTLPTLRKYTVNGQIRSKKIGTRVFYDRQDLASCPKDIRYTAFKG